MSFDPAIVQQRIEENDRLYLADQKVSNPRAKLEKINQPILGPLSYIVVGQILKYLDYDLIQLILLSLSSKMSDLYPRIISYIPIEKKAYLAVNLKDMYEGKQKMPLLHSYYYKACTDLKIIYTVPKAAEGKEESYEYENMFMEDLFNRVKFFPELKTLKICVEHHLK